MADSLSLAVLRGFPKPINCKSGTFCDEKAYIAAVDATARTWLHRRLLFCLVSHLIIAIRVRGGLLSTHGYAKIPFLLLQPPVIIPLSLALAVNFLPVVKGRGSLAAPYLFCLINAHRMMVMLGVCPTTLALQAIANRGVWLVIPSVMMFGWGIPLPLYHYVPFRLAIDGFHVVFMAVETQRNHIQVPIMGNALWRLLLSLAFGFLSDYLRRKAFLQNTMSAAKAGVKSLDTVAPPVQDPADPGPSVLNGLQTDELVLPKFGPPRPYQSSLAARRTVIKVPDLEPDEMPVIDLEEFRGRMSKWDATLHVKNVFVRQGCIILDLDMVQLGGHQGAVHDVQDASVVELLNNMDLPGMVGVESGAIISYKGAHQQAMFFKLDGSTGSWTQTEAPFHQGSHSMPTKVISQLQPRCMVLPQRGGVIRLNAWIHSSWLAAGGSLEAVVAGKAYPVSTSTTPGCEAAGMPPAEEGWDCVELQVAGLSSASPGLLHLDMWSASQPKWLLGTHHLLLLPPCCQAAALEIAAVAASTATSTELSEGFEVLCYDLGLLLEATNSMQPMPSSSDVPMNGSTATYLAELQAVSAGMADWARQAGCHALLQLVQHSSEVLEGLAELRGPPDLVAVCPHGSAVSSASHANGGSCGHLGPAVASSCSAGSSTQAAETRGLEAGKQEGASGLLLAMSVSQTAMAVLAVYKCALRGARAWMVVALTWPYTVILLAAAVKALCAKLNSAASWKVHAALQCVPCKNLGTYLLGNRILVAALMWLDLLSFPCFTSPFIHILNTALHAAICPCRHMAGAPLVSFANFLVWYKYYSLQLPPHAAFRYALAIGIVNGGVQLTLSHFEIARWCSASRTPCKKVKRD